MNQALQSGHHPDADQLSAFIEHALPLHEQEQMLAHLAVCPGCREAAFLAQPAILEATTAIPRPVATQMTWYSGWSLALAAGLAFAFLVVLSFHLRNVRSMKNDYEMNKIARVEQAAPQPTPPIPLALPSRPIITPARTVPAGTGLPANALTSDSESGASFKPSTPSAIAPSRAPVGQSPAIGNANTMHGELRSSATQYNSALITAQSSLNQALQTTPSAPPPPAPSPTNQTVTVTDAPPLPEAESDISPEVISGRAIGALAVPTLKVRKEPSLPSHLPALSTVSSAGEELAIDTAGSLFRSEDAGASWQPVPVQWTGRVVKLQLSSIPVRPPLITDASSAALAAAKVSPTPTAPSAFEITNETGTVWISEDGQTWKRK